MSARMFVIEKQRPLGRGATELAPVGIRTDRTEAEAEITFEMTDEELESLVIQRTVGATLFWDGNSDPIGRVTAFEAIELGNWYPINST